MSKTCFSPGRTLARLLAASALLATLAACGDTPPPAASAPRQVEVAVVETSRISETARLTGDIQARDEVELGFRIGGKVVERLVNVGDSVVAGQVLARLDTETERNTLNAAKAVRVAALGEVEQTRGTFERQDHLMRQGFTTRRQFEQALAAKEVAQARLDEADAQVAIAQDRLGFAELRADAPGIVTTRTLETGEVVQPGQVVLRLARDSGRDAVFDVAPRFLDQKPAGGQFRVSLASDPERSALGRVREISPQADPVTGTFRIRVGLDHPPAAMQLGSTVVGVLEKSSSLVVSVPASALTVLGTDAAVWVVDPATSRVGLRRIEVMRFEYARVIVMQGLEPGERVVSAGIQALHPGQMVQILPSAARNKAGLSSVRQARLTCRQETCGHHEPIARKYSTVAFKEFDA